MSERSRDQDRGRRGRFMGKGRTLLRRVALASFALALALAHAGGPTGTANGAFMGTNGRLAFVRGGDIWVADADGSNAVQLTTDPAVDRSPRWSPDGTEIAFASGRDGDFEIFVMNADRSDQRQLTFNTGVDCA